MDFPIAVDFKTQVNLFTSLVKEAEGILHSDKLSSLRKYLQALAIRKHVPYLESKQRFDSYLFYTYHGMVDYSDPTNPKVSSKWIEEKPG